MNPRRTRKTNSALKQLIDAVRPYELIGLGEATHGNYKNAEFRASVIMNLILNHGVRELILEDDVFVVQKINIDQELTQMKELQYPFDNRVMRSLFTRIFAFNKQNPTDKVTLIGADIQRFQIDDQSDNSNLGKLYRKYAQYKPENRDTHEPRDRGMSKMIEAQHQPGKKAALIFHNGHLTKSEKEGNMGFHLNKLYPGKFTAIANTFTKGTYQGLFMPSEEERSEGLKTNFQEITVNTQDPFYIGSGPTFYKNPTSYLWEGHGGVDKRNPMRYFFKKPTAGFDGVLFINNERPLFPNKTNQIFH